MASPLPSPDADSMAESLIAACLREQRIRRPECQWLVAVDFAGRGHTVIIPELPATDPAVYDTWPWSGLANFHRTRRELRALGFDQLEAR